MEQHQLLLWVGAGLPSPQMPKGALAIRFLSEHCCDLLLKEEISSEKCKGKLVNITDATQGQKNPGVLCLCSPICIFK